MEAMINWDYEFFSTDIWLKTLIDTLNSLEIYKSYLQNPIYFISFMRTGIINQTPIFWITLTEKELWDKEVTVVEWNLDDFQEKIYKKHPYSIDKVAKKGEDPSETEKKWKIEAENLNTTLIKFLSMDKVQQSFNNRANLHKQYKEKIFIGEYFSEGKCIFSKGE